MVRSWASAFVMPLLGLGMASDTGESLYRPYFVFDGEPRRLYDLATWANGLAFKNINFTARDCRS